MSETLLNFRFDVAIVLSAVVVELVVKTGGSGNQIL